MQVEMKFPSGALCSRAAAHVYMSVLMDHLSDSTIDTIIIDFELVDVMSYCYVDECIGIPVLVFGFDTFKSKVKLLNMNSSVGAQVARVIRDRISQSH